MTDQDKRAIIELLNLYGLAVDSQRWALFDRVFTRDVIADFSPSAQWRDLAGFKADFAAFHLPFDITQHAMTSHLVHVDGDSAQSLTYGSWRLVRHAAEGGPLWDGTGWYDDALVRTSAGWRIRHRVCRISWWTGNPRVNETIPGVRFELDTTVLRHEAEAGRVAYLKAIGA